MLCRINPIQMPPSQIGLILLFVFLSNCQAGEYDAWPQQHETFPWIYSPDPHKPDYADARWETEAWDLYDTEMGFYYLEKSTEHYKTASPQVVEHFNLHSPDLPPLGSGITLSFAGDILWINDNHADFAKGVATITEADVRVANLETPTSPEHPIKNGGIPIEFNSPVTLLDGLPFDLLQLNNNHSLDAGDEGLNLTQQEVTKRGMQTTGLREHAMVSVGDSQIAFLSYTWGLNRRNAVSEQEIFIVPFGHLGQEIDLSSIKRHITTMRQQGTDYIVLTLHWGFEYEYYPEPHFLQLARTMVSLGADVIVGHGPHIVQPAELCWVNHPEIIPRVGTCSVRSNDGRKRRAAIFYSLGNFSNSPSSRQPSLEVGIIAKVSLEAGEITGMGWSPVVVHYEPTTVTPLDSHLSDTTWAEESERLNNHLGAHWRLVQ